MAASSVFATADALAQVPPVGASAEVRDAQGRLVANAEFREGRGEVLITILFPQPAALTGTHGVRIHEVGRCDPPNFSTAGNGFNPTGKKHGRQNTDGPQIGDLPNVNFTTGLTSYNTSTPGATLAAGPTSLLGPSKSSLVIYSGEDDQLTDPDGKAGSRIACGVINAAAGAANPVAAQPAVPKPVTSPVAAVPAPVQQVQPPVAQAPPALPKPAAVASPSPVAAQAQPALPKPVVSPSPAVAVATAAGATPPTIPPLAAQPAATQTNSGGVGTGTALIIAVLGVGLVGAGWLLRRRSQMRG